MNYTKWEYKIVQDGEMYFQDMQMLLDRFGGNGWELITASNTSRGWYYFFKRQLISKQEKANE